MCAEIGRTTHTQTHIRTYGQVLEELKVSSAEDEKLFFYREFHEDSKWLLSPINRTEATKEEEN